MNGEREEPWNKGKFIGDKLPFTLKEVKAIKKNLKKRGDLKGLVLFSVAIDSSLRGGDLLKLKASDVLSNNGMIRQEVMIQMQKTKKRVTFALFKKTRKNLLYYIQKNGIQGADYLFEGRFKKQPISKETFRRLIKQYASDIGLNPEHYSGHSTRRTRMVHLAINGVADTIIAELLGVRVQTVRHYIRRVALQVSKKFPM